MSVEALWPVATDRYSLAAGGDRWHRLVIRQPAGQERDTLLVVASLMALALHYGGVGN